MDAPPTKVVVDQEAVSMPAHNAEHYTDTSRCQLHGTDPFCNNDATSLAARMLKRSHANVRQVTNRGMHGQLYFEVIMETNDPYTELDKQLWRQEMCTLLQSTWPGTTPQQVQLKIRRAEEKYRVRLQPGQVPKSTFPRCCSLQ
jgi:hypothetical protein